ncbi:MAG: hypothetical protein ACK5PP_15325 [Acidimicrobiales bacterium]
MADTTSIGGYRLVAVAGSGGFGITYVANTRTNGTVALKVLSPELAG